MSEADTLVRYLGGAVAVVHHVDPVDWTPEDCAAALTALSTVSYEIDGLAARLADKVNGEPVRHPVKPVKPKVDPEPDPEPEPDDGEAR